MDHLNNEFILTIGGLLSGILSGFLGAGGGVLCVPLLIALNYEPIQALGTSCLAVSIISISGSIQNSRMGFFNLKRVIFIGIPALVTTQISAYAVSQVPPYLLLIVFGTVMLLLIYLVRFRKHLIARAKKAAASEVFVSSATPFDAGRQPITYLPKDSDVYVKRTVAYAIEEPVTSINTSINTSIKKPSSWLTSIATRRFTTGILAGLFAGMVGGGSGTLLVPLQMLLLEEGIKISIQTSIGVNVITSVSAWTSHATRGNVLFIDGFLLGIGGFLGAQIGTRFLPKLSEKVVGFAFNTLVISLSMYVYWKAWNIYSHP